MMKKRFTCINCPRFCQMNNKNKLRKCFETNIKNGISDFEFTCYPGDFLMNCMDEINSSLNSAFKKINATFYYNK